MSKATDGDAANTVSLEINGQEVQAAQGQTILEAAQQVGIDIPTLCQYDGLTNVGACRMCLVEVDGKRLETACTTSVQEDMDVEVDTDELWDHRRTILELMFSEENHYCMYCEMEGDCELEDLFNKAGLDSARFDLEYEDVEVDTSSEYITMDFDRCIGCGRCIRTCDEVVANGTLNFGNRGREATIVADNDVPLGESSCISCGACVEACPTGAIYSTYSAYKGREADCEVVETTCNECSVGCELEVYTNSGRIVKIEGADGDAAGGQLCEMGRFELMTDRRERITDASVDGETVSVEAARERVTEVLEDARAINAVASDRLPTETLEAFEFALEDFAANFHVPGAQRAKLDDRVVEAVAAEFGTTPDDLLADSIQNVQDADTVVVYDTDVVESHPVVASYVRRAANDGGKLITIDEGEDRLERHADVSVDVCSPLADLTSRVADTVAGEDTTTDEQLDDVSAIAQELQGDTAIVVGPNVEDVETLVNVFGLAAQSGSEVVSLNRGSNQAFHKLDVEAPFDDPDVAYLFAADARGSDLDDMIDEARKADYVVVQATRESPLTKMADVVLPALDWFERQGTFIDADGQQRQITGVLNSRAPVETDRDIVDDIQEVDA